METHIPEDVVRSVGVGFHNNGMETVLLAGKYFENLKAGKDRMTALTDACAEIRKMGYEHPFYWAPFILIGEVN